MARSFPLPSSPADADPSCRRCDAVCCRLTVVVMPEDRGVPRWLVERNAQGVEVMARDEDGWCAAIDPQRMSCSIYADRPAICRSFAMGGAYCLDIRATYREQRLRGIPLTLY
ncbi:YkgJ family cysteine cluster protein [Pseudoxanthomonas koreensis]|uniref:YkgJ family cysteine cluster protein n=1 Tax=Pseudoxanthomonas koreensis TaxID=266061 RepID=UPI001EE45EF6|nr:YkgJ family cysteine cluster protein [Pseudoxanthomonas koreensis]